jgi:hypothetical protein
MTIYIAVVNTEGDAESMWTTGVIPDVAEGPAPWDDTKTIVHLNGALEDTGTYVSNNYYKDGSWHTREGRPSQHHIWKDEAWELNSTSFWVEVRILRDNLLTASDWTQIADNALTDAEKVEWVEYRQALRGVPSVNAEVVHLDLVVWPDAP